MTQGGKKDLVHSEYFPGNVIDGEIEIAELSHPQFPRGLIYFAEDMWQKSGEGIAIQTRWQLARHFKTVR